MKNYRLRVFCSLRVTCKLSWLGVSIPIFELGRGNLVSVPTWQKE